MGKRILTFVFGFLFGIVAVVGSVAGVGYWAYKNLDLATLEKWGWVDSSSVLGDDSDLKKLSVEGWIKEMTQLAAGAQDTSIEALTSKYKIKLPENIRKYIPDAMMTIPLKKLTEADGLDTVLRGTNLDYVFQFLSADALSPYLRQSLGAKSLKAVLSGDISALTEGLYVGYLLNGVEFETDGAGNVAFTEVTVGVGTDAHTVRRPIVVHKEGADAMTETMAALEVKRLYEGLTDADGVGLLGVLAQDIGDKRLTDMLPVGSNSLIDALLGGKNIDDVIVRSETTGKYAISVKELTADVYVGELMGYNQGGQKIENGSPVTDGQGNPKYDWTTVKDGTEQAVTGIEDSLANILLSDLTDGNFSIGNAVEGLYIGEIMGYQKGGVRPGEGETVKYEWYAGSGEDKKQVTGIEDAIANVSLTEMLNGGFSVESALGGMYVGELMKYVKGDEIASPDPNAQKKYEWFAEAADGTRGARVGAMEESIANILMSDLIGGKFELADSFDGLYVGELLQYLKGEAKPSSDPDAAVKFDWYLKNADGTRGAWVTGVEEALANVVMADLLNGGFNADSVFSGMYVGEMMGYEKDGLKPDSLDEYFWKSGDARVSALNDALANIQMSALLDGSFDASSMIDKLTLGDVMGYTLSEGVWTDAEGAAVTGIIGALAGKTVKQIPDAVQTMTVGEVMNMKRIDGVWYSADATGAYTVPASGITKALADLTVEDMQDPAKLTERIQNDLTLADALGYSMQNGVWVDGSGNRVSGIMGALADKKVGELATAVDDTELGVILGYQKIDGVWYSADAQGNFTIPASGVIKALADSKVNGLNDALENMEIGKIMGMEYRAPDADPVGAAVWCRQESDGTWVAADSLTAKFAAKKLNELDGDTFREVVDGLTVDEIFTGEKSGILLLLKDDPATPDTDESNPKVTDLPTVLASSVTGATMGDLVSVGIITEGAGSMAETLSSISSKLYRTESNPAEHWKTRTMAEFFADVNALLALVG